MASLSWRQQQAPGNGYLLIWGASCRSFRSAARLSRRIVHDRRVSSYPRHDEVLPADGTAMMRSSRAPPPWLFYSRRALDDPDYMYAVDALIARSTMVRPTADAKPRSIQPATISPIGNFL